MRCKIILINGETIIASVNSGEDKDGNTFVPGDIVTSEPFEKQYKGIKAILVEVKNGLAIYKESDVKTTGTTARVKTQG